MFASLMVGSIETTSNRGSAFISYQYLKKMHGSIPLRYEQTSGPDPLQHNKTKL